MSHPPAIVFDLDGTLIDSIPDVVGSLNRLLAEEGRRPITLDEGRAMVGDGARSMVERAFAATGADGSGEHLTALTERYVAIYRRFPIVETIVYPGVREVLAALRADRVPMGVCTNKPHEMSVLILDKLGLRDFFSSVIGGDALPVKKPDPRHLAAVAAEMGTDPDAVVYVGDGPTDVETARNAAVPVVVVSYGYSRIPPQALGADALIDRFEDLPRAVRELRLERRNFSTMRATR